MQKLTMESGQSKKISKKGSGCDVKHIEGGGGKDYSIFEYIRYNYLPD